MGRAVSEEVYSFQAHTRVYSAHSPRGYVVHCSSKNCMREADAEESSNTSQSAKQSVGKL